MFPFDFHSWYKSNVNVVVEQTYLKRDIHSFEVRITPVHLHVRCTWSDECEVSKVGFQGIVLLEESAHGETVQSYDR